MCAAFAQQLEHLERQIVDDLDAAANMLATIVAAVRDPSEHRTAAIAADATKLRTSRPHRCWDASG